MRIVSNRPFFVRRTHSVCGRAHVAQRSEPKFQFALEIVLRITERFIARSDEIVLPSAQLRYAFAVEPGKRRLVGGVDLAVEPGQIRIGADRLFDRALRNPAIEDRQ